MPQLLPLRIELEGITPLIWRRLIVSDSLTLQQLHKAIQAVMGWKNYHLHEFNIGEDAYGEPGEDGPEGVLAEKGVKLKDVLTGVTQFIYQYDFGDDWQHRITLEQALPTQTRTKVALCTAGENATPPEDCGGPLSYPDLLQALANPSHPDHTDLREWIGAPFDPSTFDLAAAHLRLMRIKL